MKIILVNLPLSDEESAGSFKEHANILPPLGLGYIASVLEENDFNVKIIDCRPLSISLNTLLNTLLKENPDIIGIMATVLDIPKAVVLSKKLKEKSSNALLVLGGPHITSLPFETMNNSNFDIGVIGEGEYSFLEIVSQIKSNQKANFREIKGIIYRERTGLKISSPREYIQNLDDLPFPARYLFPDLSMYRPVLASYIKLPFAHMITSRGCPYQCIFCDRKVFGNKFRARSARNVVDEIEELINIYNVKEIKFFDDTFTLQKKRVYAILNEIKRRKLDFSWSCLTRTDCIDRNLLTAMRKSGCWQIFYGLESGDQRMLNVMKKEVTVEQNIKAVKAAKRAGLNVRASFVLGIPSETMESLRNTINFAKSLPIDFANFYALTLYPGNELYKLAKKEGTIRHEDFNEYTPAIEVKKTKLAYIPKDLTEKQLKEMIIKANREFYLRPNYIIRQLFSIRRTSDIIRYFTGFETLLKYMKNKMT